MLEPPGAYSLTCILILLFPSQMQTSQPPEQFTWIDILPLFALLSVSFFFLFFLKISSACHELYQYIFTLSLGLVLVALIFKAISFDIISVFLFIRSSHSVTAADCSLLLSHSEKAYSSYGFAHLSHLFSPLPPYLFPAIVFSFIFTFILSFVPSLIYHSLDSSTHSFFFSVVPYYLLSFAT